MPKIRLKYPITDSFGTLCEVELCRPREEETEETITPKSLYKTSVAPTEAQIAIRQRFKLALAYARAALADPELRAQYEALAVEQGRRPRGAAISDYLHGNDRFAKKLS